MVGVVLDARISDTAWERCLSTALPRGQAEEVPCVVRCHGVVGVLGCAVTTPLRNDDGAKAFDESDYGQCVVLPLANGVTCARAAAGFSLCAALAFASGGSALHCKGASCVAS